MILPWKSTPQFQRGYHGACSGTILQHGTNHLNSSLNKSPKNSLSKLCLADMRLYEEGAGFMRPVRPRATRPVSALESIQIEVDMNLGAMAGGERDHEHPGCAGAIYFQPSTCHGWLGLLNIICWTSEHSEESGKTSTQTGQTWSNCSLLRSSFQPQTHGSVVPALDMSHCQLVNYRCFFVSSLISWRQVAGERGGPFPAAHEAELAA